MKIRLSHKTLGILLHSAIVLAISYFIVLVFALNTKSLSFFSVLEEGDEQMSDMYLYINARKGPARLNPDITLVNVDSCKDRFEIAQLIEKIDSLHPKVIGLDIFFRNKKEAKVDSALESVIRKCNNLVISCILEGEQHEDKDIYTVCNRNFFVDEKTDRFTEGYININSNGFSKVQTFTHKLFLKRENALDTLYCFPAQIVKLYDEKAYRRLLQRTGNSELIHYQPFRFFELDKSEIDDNQDVISGKIVLVGSFSEDIHRTPVTPQMRGMEIHAQVISIILGDKYIDKIDNIWTKLLNVVFCYLFSIFCWVATTRIKEGVPFLIKLAQVIILAAAFFVGYFLFNHYNIDITYTRSIIVMGIVLLIVDVYHVGISWGSKRIHKLLNNNRNEKDNN